MNTSKKTAISVLCVAMVGGLIGITTSETRAIPPDGFLIIFTLDADSGANVGNWPVRVVQLEADHVEIPPILAETDDYGTLYLNVPPGTYRIHGIKREAAFPAG